MFCLPPIRAICASVTAVFVAYDTIPDTFIRVLSNATLAAFFWSLVTLWLVMTSSYPPTGTVAVGADSRPIEGLAHLPSMFAVVGQDLARPLRQKYRQSVP